MDGKGKGGEGEKTRGEREEGKAKRGSMEGFADVKCAVLLLDTRDVMKVYLMQTECLSITECLLDGSFGCIVHLHNLHKML